MDRLDRSEIYPPKVRAQGGALRFILVVRSHARKNSSCLIAGCEYVSFWPSTGGPELSSSPWTESLQAPN